MKTYKFVSVIIVIAIAAVMTLISSLGYLSAVDHANYDVFMGIRKKQIDSPPPHDIVIITIDQASENHLGMRISNFSRSMLAKAINNLSSSGAAMIGIDLDLSKKTDGADDGTLAESIRNTGKAVLAAYIANNNLVQPLESFLSGAMGEGLINLKIDRDGVLRSTYVVLKTEKGFYLSLPVSMAMKYKNPRTPVVEIGSSTIRINDTTIPATHGTMLINYADGDTFSSIPYYKVLDNTFNTDEVKGKIVLIGNTSPLYHDYYNIPFKGSSGRKTMYGVEIYASAINTLLQKKFISRLTGNGIISFIGVFIVFAGILLLIVKKPVSKVVVLAGMLSIAGVIQWLLFTHGNFVPLSAFYTSVPLLALYSAAYGYMTEYREHRYVSKAFEHYVSKELLHKIKKDPDGLRLGGEKKEVTVLFSDIRSFTSISESVSPEKLVEFLHVFFNTMTEAIYKHHGVVDKFIGDAIMAIFGAPVSDKHHAEHSLAAGVDMAGAMADLKKQSMNIIGKNIDIGIGIHTGEVIVGNMGSDRRFNYTAIGDTVNLASRLEGLNKYFGTTCIISEATKERAQMSLREAESGEAILSRFMRQLGIVKVKGKSEGIKLYELMVGADDAFIKQNNDVWHSINNKDLQHAHFILKKLLEQKPDDKICGILLQKIEQALSSGKPFDPIIEMLEK